MRAAVTRGTALTVEEKRWASVPGARGRGAADKPAPTCRRVGEGRPLPVRSLRSRSGSAPANAVPPPALCLVPSHLCEFTSFFKLVFGHSGRTTLYSFRACPVGIRRAGALQRGHPMRPGSPGLTPDGCPVTDGGPCAVLRAPVTVSITGNVRVLSPLTSPPRPPAIW